MENSDRKILLIEDDPASYKLIMAALKTSGYTILLSESGNDALTLFENHQDISLVLLDIQLPVLTL